MQRRPEPPDSGSQQHDISTERTVRMSPGSFPMPAVAQAQAPEVPGAPTLAAAGVPIAPPTMQPGGGLTTYIGEPALATQVASAARAAQDRAQADVSTFARSVAEIAATLHDHAARLERFVEGSFSTDLADPRTRLLSQSLEIARQADLHLARLGDMVRRLTASVQLAQSNLDALQRERERLTTLYHIAQELNTSLELEDLLGRVMAQLI
jgi:hypothetical protein